MVGKKIRGIENLRPLWERILIYLGLGLILIAFLGLGIINYDQTYCKYESDNLLIEGKCSQFFLLTSNEDFLRLIVADYEFSNLDKIPEYLNQVADLGEELNLDKEEKIELVGEFLNELDFLDEVHNDIF